MQLSKSSIIKQLITPTEGAAGTTAIASAVIDMADVEGALIVATFGAISSGAVTSIKAQHSESIAAGYSQVTVGTTYNELRVSASSNVKLAATRTTVTASSVKHVFLQLKKQGTLATGKKLTLTIEADNSGAPTGTALGTAGTVDIDTEVSTASDWVQFTFANPVDLAAATKYHFVLAGDYTASGDNNVCWRSATVASDGNSTANDGSSWTATATEDFELFTRDYVFADIEDSKQTVADTDDGEVFYIDVTKPSKPHLRLYVSRATQNAVVASAEAIVYGNGSQPTTQPSGVNGESIVGPATGTA
jgi:hypothetical protein